MYIHATPEGAAGRVRIYLSNPKQSYVITFMLHFAWAYFTGNERHLWVLIRQHGMLNCSQTSARAIIWAYCAFFYQLPNKQLGCLDLMVPEPTHPLIHDTHDITKSLQKHLKNQPTLFMQC